MKKNYTISIPIFLFWTRVVPLALVVLFIGGIAGIFVVDVIIMPRVAGVNRGMVTVPPIVGLEMESGREKLYGAGLLTEIKNRLYDDKIAGGSILSQYPVAGEKVKKGRRIAIEVSKGKEFAKVPNIEQMTEHQARVTLKKNGFTVGDVQKKFDEKIPDGEIIMAQPLCGSTISRDMKIDLILSKGPKPTHAEMPSIAGENLKDAQTAIEENGLKIGSITYKSEKSVLPGTIISQSISPGERVLLGSSVDITVSVIE